MKSLRPVFAIAISLFVLGGASLLDVARMQPQQIATARGDHQDMKDSAIECKNSSFIAACASNMRGSMAAPPVALIQVYDSANQTTLVRVKLGE